MNFKEDFPMLKNNLIYFDNGATTFKPQYVLDSIVSYYKDYTANCHRGDYKNSLKVDMEFENTRDKVKNFINAQNREEIVFTSGATESLNYIVNGYFKNILKKGDEVLITDSEHASNVLPWFNLANTLGIKVKYIELNDDLEVTLDNLKKQVTNDTKVISLAHITNVVGDIRPIEEICKYAHENSIYVVVDGAQSVPHIKTDVQKLDIDFLAFSAHKMLGPTGCGVLYGKIKYLEELKPVNLGGGMNESFDSENEIYLKDLPTRLEAGTPNIEGVIGLGAAIDYINKIGIENIERIEQELKEYLINKLNKIKHIKILNENAKSGIVAFNVDGIFAQDVAVYLDKYNICVRAGNHCAKILKKTTGIRNTVRISLYFYNTKDEIDKLINLLSDKEKIINEMI